MRRSSCFSQLLLKALTIWNRPQAVRQVVSNLVPYFQVDCSQAYDTLPFNMAHLAAMRQAYVRIGFTIPGSVAVVDDQGIASIEELGLLTDDEVEGLCKTIRRPGGTVAGQGQAAPPVPNPGVAVSLRAETNMNLAAY